MTDYYSENEPKKPADERRYHNNKDCPPGSEIKRRKFGKLGTLCGKCKQMNEAARRK
jgi:hypothetical protein